MPLWELTLVEVRISLRLQVSNAALHSGVMKCYITIYVFAMDSHNTEDSFFVVDKLILLAFPAGSDFCIYIELLPAMVTIL